MPVNMTWDRLRELAAFRAEKGCAISLYLDLDPSIAPTAGDVQTRVNSLLDQGGKSGGATRRDYTHAVREGLKADLERIRGFFRTDFDRDGARGYAVFSAGLDGFWSALPLAEAVPDAVTVAPVFHLAPLVPLVGRGDGALVAVVGREQGHLYRLQAGQLEEIVDRFEEQPGRHDQGGWSQARYQRHIEKVVSDHLRAFADELEQRVRRLRSPRLVIVCAEQTRPEFSKLLATDVEQAIVGWTSAEAHAGPPELLELARPLLDGSRADEEAALLARWREEAGRNGRAASGWGTTLEAASDGRVDVLLYQNGVERTAYQCPKCGRASAEPGTCPLDGTRMDERGEGLDVAVHQTLAHGGTVWAVRNHDDLGPVEGIGAILRF